MTTAWAAAPAPAGIDELAALPRPYRITDRSLETADTVTIRLEAIGEPLPVFSPGQFAMITSYGIGESAISVSGQSIPPGGGAPVLVHTLRAVGAVTRALFDSQPGTVLGMRGPYGTTWDVTSAAGRDIVVVAGGIGLAPLRPVVHEVLANPSRYGRLVVLFGARTPADLLYRDELAQWRELGALVEVTVDRGDPDWTGDVGVVTTLMPRARFAAAEGIAFVCGPDIMMRFSAEALLKLGMPVDRIRVSLERNMRCGVGWCGHCQYGPLLVCRDGPVVTYDQAAPLMSVREL